MFVERLTESQTSRAPYSSCNLRNIQSSKESRVYSTQTVIRNLSQLSVTAASVITRKRE
jgi:hypothetical protein